MFLFPYVFNSFTFGELWGELIFPSTSNKLNKYGFWIAYQTHKKHKNLKFIFLYKRLFFYIYYEKELLKPPLFYLGVFFVSFLLSFLTCFLAAPSPRYNVWRVNEKLLFISKDTLTEHKWFFMALVLPISWTYFSIHLIFKSLIVYSQQTLFFILFYFTFFLLLLMLYIHLYKMERMRKFHK